MSAVFRIDVEDHTGTPVASIKNFQYFSCEIRVGLRGSFRLQLHDNDPLTEFLQRDYIIRYMYKNNEYNIPWTNVFTGILKTPSRVWYSNGNRLNIFYGSDSNELFDKSNVYYATSHPRASKNVIASTAIAELIEENITTSATVANGRYIDHINPVTVTEDSPSVGPIWEGTVANDKLTTALQEIRKYTHDQGDRVDYRVDYLGNYTWDVKVGKLYFDRTINGLSKKTGLNGAGLPPVVLSPLYKNVKQYTESIPRVQESNVVVALGRRTGLDREFAVAIDNTSVGVSPIAQRESIAQTQNQDDIVVFADTELQARVGKLRVLVEPKFSDGFALFRDMNVGDFFTILSLDNEPFNKQFTELKIVIQQTLGGRTIDKYTIFTEDREY